MFGAAKTPHETYFILTVTGRQTIRLSREFCHADTVVVMHERQSSALLAGQWNQSRQ
jgi:hypothetical protein